MNHAIANAVANGRAIASGAPSAHKEITSVIAEVNEDLAAVPGLPARYTLLERDGALYFNPDGADGWHRVATFERSRCGYPVRAVLQGPAQKEKKCFSDADVGVFLRDVLESGETWTHDPTEAHR